VAGSSTMVVIVTTVVTGSAGISVIVGIVNLLGGNPNISMITLKEPLDIQDETGTLLYEKTQFQVSPYGFLEVHNVYSTLIEYARVNDIETPCMIVSLIGKQNVGIID